MKLLEIPRSLWSEMVRELKERGHGVRESGAFILGSHNSKRASRFVCYDDLDQEALSTGIVTVHAQGFVKLWQICMDEKLTVLADVHTHPSTSTDQSDSDSTHPMVAQKGHVAIILPLFAKRSARSLRGAGIFEYLGDHEWQKWSAKSNAVFLSPT